MTKTLVHLTNHPTDVTLLIDTDSVPTLENIHSNDTLLLLDHLLDLSIVDILDLDHIIILETQ